MIPLNHIYYHYLDWKDKALTARMFNCSIELVNEAINRYTPEIPKEPKLFNTEHYIKYITEAYHRAAEAFDSKHEPYYVANFCKVRPHEAGSKTMQVYRDIYFEKLRLKNQ